MKSIKPQLFASLAFALGILGQAQAQTFLTNGLVAYYPFDGNANDASGNGRNGTVVGVTLVPDRFNNPAGAFSFTNQGEYIVVTNSLQPQGEFTGTYSCWIFLKATNVLHQSILNVGTSFGGGFVANSRSELGIVTTQPSGSPSYVVYTGEGNDFTPPQAKVSPNDWHQLAVTKAGTNIAIIVDGILLATGSTLSGQDVTNHQLFIGWNGDPQHNFGEQFYGLIDDVRIYNRALSTNEIQQLYAYESGPRVDLIKIVQPSLSNLTHGTNYQLQVSTDLNSWTNQGAVFTATNSSVVYPQYFDVQNWDQLFFRVRVAP